MTTHDERDADEALRTAIDTSWRVYVDTDNDPGVLTEYIVIAARRGFTEDGDDFYSVGSLLSDPAPSLYAQLGLLEYACSRIRSAINTD